MHTKNFTWLLIALLVFLIAIPVINQAEMLSPRSTRALTISWLLAVGVWSLRGFGRYFSIGIGLAIAGVLLNAIAANWPSQGVLYAAFTALIAFLLIAIWCTLKQVAITNEISANRLVGAVSLYLLLGVLWAATYVLVEMASPGSFYGMSAEGRQSWNSDWLYFSFVTMTTLGYGDIGPVSAIARTLAYMQALVGQFYIAILVAGLVSAYIGNRQTGIDG